MCILVNKSFFLIFCLGVLTAPITPVLHFALMQNEAKIKAYDCFDRKLTGHSPPHDSKLLPNGRQISRRSHANLLIPLFSYQNSRRPLLTQTLRGNSIEPKLVVLYLRLVANEAEVIFNRLKALFILAQWQDLGFNYDMCNVRPERARLKY